MPNFTENITAMKLRIMSVPSCISYLGFTEILSSITSEQKMQTHK